jgi:hypothetical protein
MVRSLACFEGSDLGSKMIAEFEDFTACMANQGQSGNPVAKVANGAAVTTEWTGSHPDYPGYQHVKSTQTVYSNTNGDEGTQVSHEYTSSEGMSVTVSEFTTTVNGVQSSGSSIQTNDGKGNTYYEVQNESGDVVFSFEEQSNGTVETYEKHQDGGATSVTTDGNGESDVTHTDSQGNVTTAHIKENGECEGTACSLSMPPDDYSATSNCSLHGNPIDDADEKLTADPLGPYIYPAEGSGSASDPLLACVVASMASLTPKRCPPSVALCIEPPPPGSCGCAGGATGAGGATPPPKSGQCAKMMCAEGSCNPETGTCGSGGTMPDGSPGGLCPGIIPPRPQIDIGKFHLMSPGARIPRGR